MSGVMLIIALNRDAVDEALDAAVQLPAGSAPVFVTTSGDWTRMRRERVQWEYILPEEAWAALWPSFSYNRYVSARLEHIVDVVRPVHIVEYGGALAAVHLSQLLTALEVRVESAPSVDRADGTGELMKRFDLMDKRLERVLREQKRLVLATALKQLVLRTVRIEAPTAVVSRGDPLLLPWEGAVHFPPAPDGSWSGVYPATDEEAIDLTADVMTRFSIRYLVFPEPSRWWLEKYPNLRTWLVSNGRVIGDEPGTGVVFETSAR